MLKIENIQTSGWEAAIRGMRNPMNSWDKSDSNFFSNEPMLGPNDLKLACNLVKAGSGHKKFLRMIHVQMDIVAPSLWNKENATYKVSTTMNSCSTMFRIHVKELTEDDFSHEGIDEVGDETKETFLTVIDTCNELREKFNKTKEKKYWRALIELLPSGYNVRFTYDCSMETILNMLHQRKGHKLIEWEQFRQTCLNEIPYCQEFYLASSSKQGEN